MEVLLVTTRNIYQSSGEYKLIKRRAEVLNSEFSIKTKVISFQREMRIKKTDFYNSEDFEYLIKVGFRKRSFIKDLLNFRKELRVYLNENKPERVIVSGLHIFFYDILLKYKSENVCKLFMDVHGCDEELSEYGTLLKRSIFKVIVYIIKKETKNIIVKCDGILVVSDALKNYLIGNYNLENDVFFQIPCGNYGLIKNSQERLMHREAWRKKLGIKKDEIVFVYSGGISKWQMIDETLGFLERILKINEKFRVCIFSTNIEYIKDRMIGSEKIILKSLKSDEVPLALTACDVGVILRETNLTNKVAFPTKFADYLEGGLHIILSGVDSQIDILKKYDLGIDLEDLDNLSGEEIYDRLNIVVENRTQNFLNYYATCDMLINNLLDYRENIDMFGKELMKDIK
ncbi:glycosyltransferase family protein [Paenibacillus riograndensis]|uniref:Glycosyltransferase subfamily 4-like N-terminal domain-containing protein n=1 Tax=Paenibacillus riograndensis SBR5 TaxID=1073571 RepID=A0A0E4HH27_9BACL|nr:hypothetical protein [Paenibacillus riograndensis]CQR57846.1 hypothetical protein PRIO_5457 [Paenibacillus riograndensis SBR5]